MPRRNYPKRKYSRNHRIRKKIAQTYGTQRWVKKLLKNLKK